MKSTSSLTQLKDQTFGDGLIFQYFALLLPSWTLQEVERRDDESAETSVETRMESFVHLQPEGTLRFYTILVFNLSVWTQIICVRVMQSLPPGCEQSDSKERTHLSCRQMCWLPLLLLPHLLPLPPLPA